MKFLEVSTPFCFNNTQHVEGSSGPVTMMLIVVTILGGS